MRKNFWMSATTLALALLAQGSGVYAQDKTEKKAADRPAQVEQKRQIEVIVQGTEGPGALPPPSTFTQVTGGQGDTMVFLATEMSFEGKTVKGAPYSAQAVTEMTQTLADGNRIVRKNTANIYRDSEGRTRRDQTLGSIGPYAVNGDPPQTFFINDPVAGVNYILDPRTKTARKMNFFFRTALKPSDAPAPPPQSKTPGASTTESKSRVSTFTYSTGGPIGYEDTGHTFYYNGSPGESKEEALGTQVLPELGVAAEGKRTTLTIPAGAIGNEQPINIVSERWYSKELQTVVMTRHSDPRNGETIYRLTNINRNEPAHSLFEVPGDYTIKETPPFNGQPIRRRMPAPPGNPNDL